MVNKGVELLVNGYHQLARKLAWRIPLGRRIRIERPRGYPCLRDSRSSLGSAGHVEESPSIYSERLAQGGAELDGKCYTAYLCFYAGVIRRL